MAKNRRSHRRGEATKVPCAARSGWRGRGRKDENRMGKGKLPGRVVWRTWAMDIGFV
jgi:hypothetical protein